MNILLTGACGFIGKHVNAFLMAQGHNIVECDRVYKTDVLDLTQQDLIDYNIQACIHLAAQTSVWNKKHKQIANDNITSFIHIFNLCKSNNIPFFFASSSCAYSKTTMYGISKAFDEDYAKAYMNNEHGWVCVGFRFYNVYGENQREDTLLGKLCASTQEKPIQLYNNGQNIRHFTYIDDILYMLDICLATPPANGIYTVANPTGSKVIDFCKEVKKHIPVYYECADEKRKYDIEVQEIDPYSFNLLDGNSTYTMQEGIRKIFAKDNE